MFGSTLEFFGVGGSNGAISGFRQIQDGGSWKIQKAISPRRIV